MRRLPPDCGSTTSITGCLPRRSPRSPPSRETLPVSWSWTGPPPNPGRPALTHRVFSELGDELRPPDLLVVNDSRVIPAQAGGAARHRRRIGGARPATDGRRLGSLGEPGSPVTPDRHRRPASRSAPATSCRGGGATRAGHARRAILPRAAGGHGGSRRDAAAALHQATAARRRTDIRRCMPDHRARLPHRRPACTSRRACSNPSRRRASVAPAVTLHVGLDTFRPLEGEFVDEHRIHREWYEIPTAARRAIGRARRGGRTHRGAWARPVCACWRPPHSAGARSGWSDLYITPPHDFTAVDALITNFHLPRSSLLLLVTAFVQAGMTRRDRLRGARHAARRISCRPRGRVSILQLR